MRLDTSNYHQRGAFFYGRMLDIQVQLCMLAALRAGDTCIDVGANIGLLSMLAAYAVGPQGSVVAFEPNPDVHEHLLWHLSENTLKHVRTHRLALSDREAVLRLTVPPTGNTGAATLGALPARHGGRIGAAYEVRVGIGDEVLGILPPAPMLIKLDVEGHEAAALRGLCRTVQSHRPAILLECNPEMLPANGSSVPELLELLAGWGYVPHTMGVVWSRLAREWRLRLRRVPESWRPTRTENVLFLSPDGVHAGRLRRYIQSEAALDGTHAPEPP
jgi:FkbM family methyltransferase